jgi:predicted nuclease of predicted toxin-antitoxin system
VPAHVADRRAHDAGFSADHVTHIGLGGSKDWRILEIVVREGYVLVTNDRTDFLALSEYLFPALE